jgi:hypothetical protein
MSNIQQYTATQYAKKIGVSRQYVCRVIKAGKPLKGSISYYKMGFSWIIMAVG